MRFTLASSLVALAVQVLAATAASTAGKGMASIPIAKRSTLLNADQSVSFRALDSHAAWVKAKFLGLEKLERRTDPGSVNPSAVNGAGEHGAASGVPLIGYNHNEGWYGQIEVGTPPKPFKVLFDTAMSDIFIPASTCGSTCDNHTRWNPESSSTSTNLHQNFSCSLGAVTTSGGLYTDDVSVAGFTAHNQTLGAAELYSELRSPQFIPDGMLGMGYRSLSAYNASPVFQSLISQGQVKYPRFSFKLSSPGAELRIGGSNSLLYTGELSYVPVTRKAYWQVTTDNIQSNGQTILYNVDSIIAVGISLIIGNMSEVSALYSAVGGNSIGGGYYTFPCNSFPNISLTFGGKSFPIAASALNIGPVSKGSSQCVSGIIGQNSSSLWVLGDIFLQNVYTVFDYGELELEPRVGFARLASTTCRSRLTG